MDKIKSSSEGIDRIVDKKVKQVRRFEERLGKVKKNKRKQKLVATIVRLKDEVEELRPGIEWPKPREKQEAPKPAPPPVAEPTETPAEAPLEEPTTESPAEGGTKEIPPPADDAGEAPPAAEPVPVAAGEEPVEPAPPEPGDEEKKDAPSPEETEEKEETRGE